MTRVGKEMFSGGAESNVESGAGVLGFANVYIG